MDHATGPRPKVSPNLDLRNKSLTDELTNHLPFPGFRSSLFNAGSRDRPSNRARDHGGKYCGQEGQNSAM